MMRYILTICFLSILLSAGAQYNMPKSGEHYFYLDAQCQACKVNQTTGVQDLYVISDNFYSGRLDDQLIEVYVNAFKAKLYREYDNPAPLIKNVVLRKLDSESGILDSREHFFQKYKDKNYGTDILTFEPPTPIIENRIEDYLKLVEAFGFSGSVLVAEKGNIIHENAYGWALPEYQVKNNPAVVFNIGSVAKSFTAHAILYLIQEGKLSLSTSLAEIFDEVPADKSAVTVRQLLMHTSGYKRNVLSLDEEVNSFDLAREKILRQDLTFRPGEKYNYSNAGYQLLGLIVEAISGKPVDVFLKEQLFEPNGIEGIGFFHDLPGDAVPADAMNEWSSTGFQAFAERNYANLASTGIAAGTRGIYEWFTYLQSDRDVYRIMSAPTEDNLGLGFFHSNDHSRLFSTGDHGDYHALLSYDKESERLIIILSNVSLYNFGVHRNILAKEIDGILDGNAKSYFKTLPAKKIKPIEGSYKNDEFDLSITAINHQPKLILANQNTINYFHKPDSAQLASISMKRSVLQEVADFIREEKFDQLQNWMGAFYAKVIKEDYEYYVEEYGKLKDISIVGTVPLPWNSPNYQSLMIMTYGDKKIDFRIVWDNDNIYETLTETEHPEGMVLFLATDQDGHWVTYDFIKNIRNQLSFEYDKNKITDLLLPSDQWNGEAGTPHQLKRQ